MAFAKFQENRFRIDGEIAENHAILVNLTASIVNPLPPKSTNLNFHPLEVVSRYHDQHLQVAENYSYLFHLRPNICKFSCPNTHFIPNNCGLAC